MSDTSFIAIGGRWWRFLGAQIDADSWEVEWRSDGKLYLHDGIGNVAEGTELREAEVEQMSREMLLADVLELAAAKLRSGEAVTKVQPEMSSMGSGTQQDCNTKHWLNVIPAVQNVPFLKNPQNPHISPANSAAELFDRIVEALRENCPQES